MASAMHFESDDLAILESALRYVRDLLEALPPTPEVQALQHRAETYEATLNYWAADPPPPSSRVSLGTQVAELTLDVARARWSGGPLAHGDSRG
jgi:hypothetical protein